MLKRAVTHVVLFLVCFSLYGQENEPMTIPMDYEHFGSVYDIAEYELDNAILIASEKGLFRYTGKVLTPFYSNSDETFHQIFIEKNNVYALSFNNSIYQLKNDSLSLIHHFEENIKDLIVINDAIYVTAPNSLYVGDRSEFKKINLDQDVYHLGFIKTDTSHFIVRQSPGHTEFYNLKTHSKTSSPFDKIIHLVFSSDGDNYLVSKNGVLEFDEKSGGIRKKFDLPKRLLNVKLYDIKIRENGLVFVGHNDGLSLWDPKQQQWVHYYRGTQVHSITFDQFDNLWLGTKYEGVLQIPSIDILQNDIGSILQRNEKIVTSYVQGDCLFLGTNLGSLILWNIENNSKQVIHLNKNAEVQSMVQNDNLLYVYCDQLFVIDVNMHAVVETMAVHSTKDIHVDDEIFVATSHDVQNLTKGVKIDNAKWHNSIYYNPDEALFYLGTKTGMLVIDRDGFSVVKTVEKERNIADAFQLNNDMYMFDISGEVIAYRAGNVSKLPIKNIRKVAKINDSEVLCYNKTEVVLFNVLSNQAVPLHFISALTKGKDIVNISKSNSDVYITTLSKVFVIRNYAKLLYRTAPKDLALMISQKNGEMVSETIHLPHKNKGIELFLKSNKDLSFFTHYDVYYTIGDQEEWIKIEPNQQNALQFNLAFVPEGSTRMQFILKSDAIVQKKSIQTYVNAPFYKSYWFVLIGFISVVLLLIVLQKRRLSKMKKENLKRIQDERLKTRLFKSELTAIRSQMNPHFVFNTLSSIQLKIAKQETSAAFQMVQKFSSLMRGVLNYSQKELISLKQEFNILNSYLELEKNRFEEELVIEVDIDKEMDLEDFRIPSLITQPIAENSIQHGLKHKKGEKKIRISLQRIDAQSYTINIIDNGIGIEKAKQINAENKKPAPFAMKAIRKRISYINSLNEICVDLEIASSDQGTKTTIKVVEYD